MSDSESMDPDSLFHMGLTDTDSDSGSDSEAEYQIPHPLAMAQAAAHFQQVDQEVILVELVSETPVNSLSFGAVDPDPVPGPAATSVHTPIQPPPQRGGRRRRRTSRWTSLGNSGSTQTGSNSYQPEHTTSQTITSKLEVDIFNPSLQFSQACGRILRSQCPMCTTWGKVDKEIKEMFLNELLTQFSFDVKRREVCKRVYQIMGKIYRDSKYERHTYFKKMRSFARAVKNPPKDMKCRTGLINWKNLCEHFRNPDFKKQSRTNGRNRKQRREQRREQRR